MADAVLELGLAHDARGLEDALWDVDFRVLQQLMHARGRRNGVRYQWRHAARGSGDLAESFESLKERAFHGDWN